MLELQFLHEFSVHRLLGILILFKINFLLFKKSIIKFSKHNNQDAVDG